MRPAWPTLVLTVALLGLQVLAIRQLAENDRAFDRIDHAFGVIDRAFGSIDRTFDDASDGIDAGFDRIEAGNAEILRRLQRLEREDVPR